MSNNVILPGTGEPIATDDIGTAPNNAHFQRIKISDGLEDQTLPARVKNSNADSNDAGIVVRATPQNTWSVSFTRVNGSALDSPEMTQRILGAGVGVSQSAGNLVVTTGTTANSEFLARSTVTFNGSMIHRHQTVLSQRIANNNFAVLLADRIAEGASCTINSSTSISVGVPSHGLTSANVGQSMCVGAISGANGVPGRYAIASLPDADTINFTVTGWPASGSCTVDLFGWNYVRWLYTGTTATNAAVDSQRYGWNSGDTTATINTTASPGHMAQTAMDGRNIYFQDTLVASSTAPTVSVRGHRVANIPDDEIEMYVYLWSFNGTTDPVGSTSWTVGFVSIEDTVNTPVYIAGVRPQGVSAPLPVFFNQPVLIAGTAAIGDVGVQYRATATGAATITNVNCPVTPAAQQIKGAAGRLVGMVVSNNAVTTRWVKVFNALSASVTPGTTAALTEFAIAAGQTVEFHVEGGAAFATGITIMVTGGQGLTNNTAVTLGDVTGFTLHA